MSQPWPVVRPARSRRWRGLLATPVTVLALGALAGPSLAASGGTAADTSSSPDSSSSTLERIAQCESGGDPTAVSADGRYRGKYQFDKRTWRSMGGKGDPADASESEQDRRAAKLLAKRGVQPWGRCGRQAVADDG